MTPTDYEFAVPRTVLAAYLVANKKESSGIGSEIKDMKLLDLLRLAEAD